MVSNEDGGDYKMTMKCSMDNTDNDTDEMTKIIEYKGIYEYTLRLKLCIFYHYKMVQIQINHFFVFCMLFEEHLQFDSL